MTLLGLLLAVAATGALVLAIVAAPGPGFDLGLIGLSIVGALLAGIVLSIDHRRLREHAPRTGSPDDDWPPPSDAPRARPPAAGDDDHARVAWALADEPGITPELRDDLLVHFGSWRALRVASVEELEEAPGVGYTLARRIRAALDR